MPVGLEARTFAKRYPHQLSGGQRQRVGLARALAAQPSVLLMDEPFGALDPVTRAEMQDMLRDLMVRMRKTVLLVTHDLDEALMLGNRIALLSQGRLVAHLASSEFLQSRNPEVEAYVRAFHRGEMGADSGEKRLNFPGKYLLRAFLRQYGNQIFELTLEHLWLTGAAMLFAAAIAIPLGVWLTQNPRWARPVIGVANVLQTIPSLAMFGFLLPLPWLGERATAVAIAALTAYALLPILRNTYAGIRGIDPTLVSVAEAMGLTTRQRLFKVQLPLAASFILAGLRTATVTCVGIATIAAAVGAGGLGELIFRGVASVNNELILAGAIPAALLALICDGALGLLERWYRVPGQGKLA